MKKIMAWGVSGGSGVAAMKMKINGGRNNQ
jgi:hypothetical protein